MSNNKKRDDDKWTDHKPWHDKPWHDKPWHDKPGHGKPGDDDSDDVGFGDGKTVVLTFDDGPAPIGALKDILKTLHHEDIKAEFFVIGSEVEENPRKTKMIVREGHDIQNHSWSHVNLATASEEQVRLELSQTQEVIADVTGVTATKIRPPFGAGGFEGNIDPELAAVAEELDLDIVTWDIDSRDTLAPQGPVPEKYPDIENQFLQQPDKTEYNILLHVSEATAAELPAFIEQLSEWGFTFGEPELF
jgi:peptidoglycan/xylan/chitin deacetylase (PgdA/CDA1 family)